ncbi:hypothetical protein ACTG2W_04705 [Aeromonas sp. 96A]|uniref:Uncharacterized protein n=1 Tax=Aeromonas veronii TaxID=654 RepID=A0AAW5M7H4_AERVE|nr:hypothetical protein [Aeromonas veronii]ANB69868.1 hypothetical protein A6033_16045 [Aeromonas veronii]EKP0317681.1 hypothetical protein [Aeromonas veronii]ELV7507186.1 hypothetical protein [Aeromonas veronii]MBL0489761.1 hypothetical protein [Aeromonas veronii]MCC0089424.1 hypothetical protein [Aeromonas veronii]
MISLTSLQQALTDNYEQIESLLSKKCYDEASVRMDYRQSLIESLLQLVENKQNLKQDAMLLAAIIYKQEESMKKMASDHQKLIFKKLSSIGLASKAKRVYSENIKGL